MIQDYLGQQIRVNQRASDRNGSLCLSLGIRPILPKHGTLAMPKQTFTDGELGAIPGC